MQLTRFTDYSLRVLMYVAAHPDRLVQIDEIVDGYGISRGHVMKVVRELAGLGYLESVRGRGGGVRLDIGADEIGVGEVVRRTEKNLAIVECFGDSGNCRLEPACGLQKAIAEALKAFLVTLDAYTLADLVSNRRELSRLMQIG